MNPSNPNLSISLVQAELAWEDIDANLRHLEALVLPLETRLIVLPEMFSTGFSMDPERLAVEAGEKGLNVWKYHVGS